MTSGSPFGSRRTFKIEKGTLHTAENPCLTCVVTVELSGLEPLTSCMPSGGRTSTRVHPCRSQSSRVPASPPVSRCVAVLPCCTAAIHAGGTSRGPRCSPDQHQPSTPGYRYVVRCASGQPGPAPGPLATPRTRRQLPPPGAPGVVDQLPPLPMRGRRIPPGHKRYKSSFSSQIASVHHSESRPSPTVKLSTSDVPTRVPASLVPSPLNSTSPGCEPPGSVRMEPATGARRPLGWSTKPV